MPNWCVNQMTVTGEPARVAAFVEEMCGDEPANRHLDFNAVAPMPRILEDRVSPPGVKEMDWYQWCNEHWGVKWNATETRVDYPEGSEIAEYRFDTPWGPPLAWQKTLVEMYPLLSFDFESTDYEGLWTSHGENGRITEESSRELSAREIEEWMAA